MEGRLCSSKMVDNLVSTAVCVDFCSGFLFDRERGTGRATTKPYSHTFLRCLVKALERLTARFRAISQF